LVLPVVLGGVGSGAHGIGTRAGTGSRAGVWPAAVGRETVGREPSRGAAVAGRRPRRGASG